MNQDIQFAFRAKICYCNIYIDSSAYPCFIFALMVDKDLINEFGDEVTIKTDCEKLLPRRDDYAELVELRACIFDAIKTIPEFMAAKSRLKQLIRSEDRYATKNSVN